MERQAAPERGGQPVQRVVAPVLLGGCDRRRWLGGSRLQSAALITCRCHAFMIHMSSVMSSVHLFMWCVYVFLMTLQECIARFQNVCAR